MPKLDRGGKKKIRCVDCILMYLEHAPMLTIVDQIFSYQCLSTYDCLRLFKFKNNQKFKVQNVPHVLSHSFGHSWNINLDKDIGRYSRCQHRRFQADLMLQIDVHEEIDGSLDFFSQVF